MYTYCIIPSVNTYMFSNRNDSWRYTNEISKDSKIF